MLSNFGEMTFDEALSMGKVPGAEYWAKFGKGNLGTNFTTVFSTIDRNTVYDYMDQPGSLWFASTDPDDTAGGTGCREITVFGEDENFDRQSEVITMNGQTPVQTVRDNWTRIYRIYNKDFVTHEVQGQIYCSDTGSGWVGGEPSGNILGHIDDGYNQTQMALYTVPRGYKLRISNIWFNSMRDREVEMSFFYREGVDKEEANCPVFRVRTDIGLYRNGQTLGLGDAPLVLDALSEFEIRGRVITSGNEDVYAVLNGYLVPEKYFN